MRNSPVTCYDDQVHADVALAASFYDSHQFDAIEQLLAPWFQRIVDDPRIVMPMTRVMLLNTLARARVMTGNGEWTELYRASASILGEVNPPDLARTWNYLVFGLLRNKRFEEAAAAIAEIERVPGITDFSRWILRFNQADLNRRLGNLWRHQEMETAFSTLEFPGHPFGFYMQGNRPSTRTRIARRGEAI